MNVKPHIGIFGRRNSGKSSLINLLTGQDTSIVSDIPGTTTDPVKKSVEIFGIGPAVLWDTAGIDDLSELGEKRIEKSLAAIRNVDCAILLIVDNQFGPFELELIHLFENVELPYFIVHNKSDLNKISDHTRTVITTHTSADIIDFSTKEDDLKPDFLRTLQKVIPQNVYQKPILLGDLVKPKDIVLLITPIDSEAPEGRLILPQNMTIRDALDNHCITIVVRETELKDFLKLGITPTLAITDSQEFDFVSKTLPENIPLTSFSILFARMKGDFEAYLEGTCQIAALKDGDKILMLESCTHQTSCDDIGRMKIPNLLKKKTGKNLHFIFVSGLDEIPKEDFALVIQCGGCMVTRKQLMNRIRLIQANKIPITNYGMTLAWLNGIFERATKVFKNN